MNYVEDHNEENLTNIDGIFVGTPISFVDVS